MSQYECEQCKRKFDIKEFQHTKDRKKCILHCEKDEWYETIDGQKDWKKSEDKIGFFWKRVRDVIKNETQYQEYFEGGSLDFTFSIFPSFEELYNNVEEYDDGSFQVVDWHDNFGDIYIAQDNYQNHEFDIRFNFRNSIFLDDVDFTYYQFKDWVSFDKTKFIGRCLFRQTIFDSVSFKEVDFFQEVLFENTSANFYSYKSGDFENSTFHDKLEFRNCNIGKEENKKAFDIDFKNTTFKSLHFQSGTFNHGIRFYKDTQAEYLDIQNINLNDLYIAGNIPMIAIRGNGKTITKLTIKHNNLNKLLIHNTIIKEDFLLNDKQYRQDDEFKLDFLNLKESTFEKKVKIQFYEVKNANFFNTKFEDLADFYQTIFSKVNFERTDFKNISVFSEAEFNCDVDFKYTKFLGKAIFRDAVITGNLNLRDSIFDDEANFLDITSKSRKVYNAEKDEYNFIGEPTDIKVANRETARIIKNFYDHSNNIIEANRFYKLEMQEKEKELDKSKKYNYLEWLIFKIHAISSNHSQNWFLALFWIVIMTFIYSHVQAFIEQPKSEYYLLPLLGSLTILIYSILRILECQYVSNIELSIISVLSYFTYSFTVNDYDLNCFANNLNPFSIMTEKGDLRFFGLLYKVLIAYLVYQFIISIRQNTRRK